MDKETKNKIAKIGALIQSIQLTVQVANSEYNDLVAFITEQEKQQNATEKMQ